MFTTSRWNGLCYGIRVSACSLRSVCALGGVYDGMDGFWGIAVGQEGEQPINEISLGAEFSFARNSFHPVLSMVEPWSGHIAVRIAGQVKVLYFD